MSNETAIIVLAATLIATIPIFLTLALTISTVRRDLRNLRQFHSQDSLAVYGFVTRITSSIDELSRRVENCEQLIKSMKEQHVEAE